MEHKKTAGKAKSAAKADHKDHKKTHSHATNRSHKSEQTGAPEPTYTVVSNEPEDMAVLSEAQQAEVFDMTFSEDPAADSRVVQDARVQAALEPVGTDAAVQPVVTEDGVVTPYNG